MDRQPLRLSDRLTATLRERAMAYADALRIAAETLDLAGEWTFDLGSSLLIPVGGSVPAQSAEVGTTKSTP